MLSTVRNLLLVLLVLLFVPGCSKREEPAAEPASKTAPAPEQPAAPPATGAPEAANPALMDPTQATEQAPPMYRVKFETTKGDVIIQVNRSWAPLGADRFYNLVKVGYLNDNAFFRVIPGFMVQFGINGNPDVNRAWKQSEIPDDPVTQSNRRGYLTFATAGPNTRTTQLFINFQDNSASLDTQGFAPIGRVVEGMSVVDSVYSGYGEGAPRGTGPDQRFIQAGGNKYLRKDFPNLDYIKTATIMP